MFGNSGAIVDLQAWKMELIMNRAKTSIQPNKHMKHITHIRV